MIHRPRHPVGTLAEFDRGLFINCPFDDQYLELLRPLLFVVIVLGFEPRLASDRSDSFENRVDKICELIAGSRYSIHDLSRLRAKDAGEFYRMNLPFELGVEYGCRQFAPGQARDKRCLVLETHQHDFKIALSDLSGIDIKSHGGTPAGLVRAVRSWFVETVGLRGVKSATALWYQFADFAIDFKARRKDEGHTDEDLNSMPLPEYVDFIREWLGRGGSAPGRSSPS